MEEKLDNKRCTDVPMAGVAQWIERGLWTKGAPVPFCQGTCLGVGQVPSRAMREATAH